MPHHLYTKQKNRKLNQSKSKCLKDVVNLYPSVPLDRSIQDIVDFLQEDHSELKKRIKLNLTNIHQLLELCLSECYFLFNNVIWTREN